jgi:hypothetical protein
MVGLSHHRWFVEVVDGALRFVPKYQFIHTDWRYSFPRSFHDRLTEQERVSSLFWTDSLPAEEVQFHGLDALEREITTFIQSVRPYSRQRLAWAAARRRAVASIVNRLPWRR